MPRYPSVYSSQAFRLNPRGLGCGTALPWCVRTCYMQLYSSKHIWSLVLKYKGRIIPPEHLLSLRLRLW